MATKGSIFSPILVASVVITSEKLVAYPCCTQASKSASIAFVAQTGNAFTCLSHSSGIRAMVGSRVSHLLRRIFSIGSPPMDLLNWISFDRSSQSDLLRQIFSIRSPPANLLRRIFLVGSPSAGLLSRISSDGSSLANLLFFDGPQSDHINSIVEHLVHRIAVSIG